MKISAFGHCWVLRWPWVLAVLAVAAVPAGLSAWQWQRGEDKLATLARIAVQRDCGRFEWSVLDWNAPAIGFYRTLGATGLDEWTVQRLEGDALHALASHDAL